MQPDAHCSCFLMLLGACSVPISNKKKAAQRASVKQASRAATQAVRHRVLPKARCPSRPDRGVVALQTARDRRAENRRKNQAAKRQAALAEKRSVRGKLLVCASLRSCAEPGARVLMFAACQEASCEVLVASCSVWWLAYGRDFQKSRMCGAQRHTVHVEPNRLAIGLPTHPPFMAAATRSCHRLPCGSNVITRLSSSSPCPQFPVCCMNTSSLLRGANSPRRSAHSIRHTSGEWAEQPQSR